MKNKIDPLDSEVSFSVSALQTSDSIQLVGKSKSRFISAVDRLCGNIIDLPNAKIEEYSKTKRARTDARVAEIQSETQAKAILLDAATNAFANHISANPELAERALTAQLDGFMRKQINKDAVAASAYEELKNSNPHDSQNTPDKLDDDWLNLFELHAEKASSENMRMLFGKILSGEIRKQNSFSLTTLRIAAELDQFNATNFVNLAGCRIDKNIPLTNADKDSKFEILIALEATGLLQFSAGNLSLIIPNGEATQLIYGGREFGMSISVLPGITQLVTRSAILTKSGLELASLFANDEVSALKIIVNENIDKLQSAKICGWRHVEGKTYFLDPSSEILLK